MLSPERNDISLAKLFNWGKQFDIFDNNDQPFAKVYIRLVGDAELNRARVHSLRKSAELRKKLHNLESDERVAYIVDKELATKEWLISYLLIGKTKNLSSEALKTVYVKYPKEPEGEAKLEELEKYQEEVDNFDKKVTAEVKKYITKQVTDFQKTLETRDIDSLYNEYVEEAINSLCEEEGYFRFRDMCVFFGSFKDSKYQKPFFSSLDEVENLVPSIKGQFINNYLSLEVTTEDLKK